MRRPTVRYTAPLAGVAAIALLATACGGGGDSGGSVPAGYFTAYSTQPQRSIQPANANETGGAYALDMMFRGLYKNDPKTGGPVEVLAAGFETTDNTNFTIKVKPGTTFHNGEPVNAKSFVDAWNWAANTANKQINASWFSIIEGYDAVHPKEGAATAKEMSGLKLVDDNTFTVKLSSPDASFKAKLGYVVFNPLPQEFYKDPEKYGKEPIGNGPFQIDTKNGGWAQKKSITVKRWDGYQGEDKAKSAGARLLFYTGYDAGYTALRDNKLDVIDQIPPSANANFQKDLGDRAIIQPQLSIQKMAFPLYNEEWKKPEKAKVRQGLSMAINREAILKALYQNNRPAAIDWLAPGVPGHGDVLGEFGTYNPTRAKELIAEGGGVPGGKIVFSSNADGPHKPWMDAVCNSIQADAGVPCETKMYPEFATFREDVTGKKMGTGTFRTGWKADYDYPDNFLADIYKTGAASNDSGYSNPTFDDLAKRAAGATTQDAAITLWKESEKELVKDMPSIPLWYYVTTAGRSDKVTDVNFDVYGTPVWTGIVKK